jgi:tRNA dimethylallyltransferase
MTMMSIPTAKPVAIMLMGPTASGKTNIALKLFDEMDCELINVDSAQFFKGMDIGTAKLSEKELQRYPHRMMSFLDPTQSYSIAQFQYDILAEISDILDRGKTPLLIGGSMMYFKVLIEGMSQLPKTDPLIRQHVESIYKDKGLLHMHEWLSSLDSDSALRLHVNDTQRVLRAIEVCLMGNKTMTAYLSEGKEALEYPCRWLPIALVPSSRQVLHANIEARFHSMLEQGFLREVEQLYQRSDLHANLTSMRSVGYKQAWAYLEGRMSYNEMIEKAVISTRQFAKRQFTWLRGWSDELAIYDSTPVLEATLEQRDARFIALFENIYDDIILNINRK